MSQVSYLKNNMNKPVFVDFGCGPNLQVAIEYKKKGYYIIIVERSEKDLYNHSDMDHPDMEWFKIIADEIFFFDITDLSKTITHKADAWLCSAVLEHIKSDNIDLFLKGMKNHCKKNSQGLIYIDLTDHHGGFNHRVNPENYKFIKNSHEEKEWYEIIEKYFTIETWHKLFWNQNKDYMNMKEKLETYVAPDILGFDKMYDVDGNGYYTVLGSENKEEIFNCGNCIGLDFNVFV